MQLITLLEVKVIKMFNITVDEIEYAEKILLPVEEKFDEERRRVIQCLESKDIIACPGSGKTTTILAKLVIIAKQLPLDNNKGVCVLTHTNVAINEITERLGDKSKILFKYPNYFGTIQSFVDKYLAIPAYAHYFKKRPLRIDNEIYYEQVEKSLISLGGPAKNWLDRQRDPLEKLKEIRFSLEDFDNLVQGLNGNLCLINRDSPTFKGLKEFKLNLMESGILCFDDAYSLAYRYLRDFPQLKNVFSERFAIVLIDEMQDTDKHQEDLLHKLFNERVIIQKIGDNNQAIFSSTVKDNVWNVNEDCLTITNSKRFSNSIARIVNKVCLAPHEELKGLDSIPEIKPKLLLFNDSSIDKVLKTFGDLIFKYNLQECKRNIYKAVGWVGKPKENKYTIQSYWNNYSREEQHRKNDFNSLASYLQTKDDELIKNEGANYYRKALLRAILKCLRIVGKKNLDNRFFNELTLLRFLEDNYNEVFKSLKLKLTKWCLDIHKGLSVTQEVKEFIIHELCASLDIEISGDLQQFLDANIDESDGQSRTIIMPNIYKHCCNGTEIDIHISTIHSVKGETHTATLYLETFYYQYDVLRIIEYLKGNYSEPSSQIIKYNLKMAHVAMSRPTHLLCVAAHEDNIGTHLKELQEFGWEVVKVNEN